MKNSILILILMLSLFSCKKEIDDLYFEQFWKQTVYSGNHECGTCDRETMKYFSGNVYKADIRLDTTLFVENEGSFQSKLFGFFEDQIHNNSVRVSYHSINRDTLQLKTYVYNSGNRRESQNKIITNISRQKVVDMLDQDGFIPVQITILENSYLVNFGNIQEISLTRTCDLPIDTIKYLTNHYYGGPDSIVAPHDMIFWIRFDPMMKQ
jgi:hypothetical protein